jgi:hypothetical protein
MGWRGGLVQAYRAGLAQYLDSKRFFLCGVYIFHKAYVVYDTMYYRVSV